jgi:hypothetical protein
MRKMTMNCLALGAVLAAVAPARADDQAITDIPRSLIAAHQQAPRPEVGAQAYGAAFGASTQSGGFPHKTCSHVGGPKVGSWGCR